MLNYSFTLCYLTGSNWAQFCSFFPRITSDNSTRYDTNFVSDMNRHRCLNVYRARNKRCHICFMYLQYTPPARLRTFQSPFALSVWLTFGNFPQVPLKFFRKHEPGVAHSHVPKIWCSITYAFCSGVKNVSFCCFSQQRGNLVCVSNETENNWDRVFAVVSVYVGGNVSLKMIGLKLALIRWLMACRSVGWGWRAKDVSLNQRRIW